VVPASSRVLRSNAAGKKSLIGVGLANFPQSYQHFFRKCKMNDIIISQLAANPFYLL
jgi:hypothetical protein